jgi:hypothetical protein
MLKQGEMQKVEIETPFHHIEFVKLHHDNDHKI